MCIDAWHLRSDGDQAAEGTTSYDGESRCRSLTPGAAVFAGMIELAARMRIWLTMAERQALSDLDTLDFTALKAQNLRGAAGASAELHAQDLAEAGRLSRLRRRVDATW